MREREQFRTLVRICRVANVALWTQGPHVVLVPATVSSAKFQSVLAKVAVRVCKKLTPEIDTTFVGAAVDNDPC